MSEYEQTWYMYMAHEHLKIFVVDSTISVTPPNFVISFLFISKLLGVNWWCSHCLATQGSCPGSPSVGQVHLGGKLYSILGATERVREVFP